MRCCGCLSPRRPPLLSSMSAGVFSGMCGQAGPGRLGAALLQSVSLSCRVSADANLSVDHSGSNHFLIPHSLDIGGFLTDSAVIVSTSDSLLDKRYVQTGARMTYFELRSYLAHRPEVRLAYIRSGRYREIARAGDSPEFSARPHLLLRKLLVFRPLGRQAGRICDW